MHRAPAVNFSVNRSRWHARLVVCLTLLALVALAAFVAEETRFDLRTILLVSAILVASLVALMGWKQSPKGTLRWDGEHWFWSEYTANPECRLRLLIDFQWVVLVAVAAGAQEPDYLWLEAIPADASWRSLRRAIVSSQAVTESSRKNGPLSVDGDIA